MANLEVNTHFLLRRGDTLQLSMVSNSLYDYEARRRGSLDIKYDENDEKIIYSTDVRLIVRSTKDSVGKVVIEKRAEGRDYIAAKDRAEAIDYAYTYNNSKLELDAYFTTPIENKYRDQEIELIVYIPEGTILYADSNTYSFHRNDSYYRDILKNGDEEQYLLIEDGDTRCLDCPVTDEDDKDEDEERGIYIKGKDGDYVRIDKDGVNIQNSDGDAIIIERDGIDIKTSKKQDTIKIKIDN